MSTIAGGLYRRLAASRPIQGFDVIGIDDLSPDQCDRLDGSLRLIREFGPWVFRHAVQDLDGIGILDAGGPRYGGWVNLVWVSVEWLDGEDEEWIAAATVYAMTTARILRAWPHRGHRFRRFRMAFERQVSFARRLPGGVLIAERLTRFWDDGWYSPERQREVTVRTLRQMDAPEWVVRVFRWLTRRRAGGMGSQ